MDGNRLLIPDCQTIAGEAFTPLMVTLPFTTWIQMRLQRQSDAPTAHLSPAPNDTVHILMHFQ